jgi:uncharacterized Zn-finger protein
MISCGTTPIDRLALRGCSSMSKPQIVTLPPVFTTSPARMLISVDLPAPLGPSRPKICPRGTSKLTSSSARLPPLGGIGLRQRFDADRGVACDGSGEVAPALGHPRVFLRIDEESGFVECGYCDRRFVLEGDRRTASGA